MHSAILNRAKCLLPAYYNDMKISSLIIICAQVIVNVSFLSHLRSLTSFRHSCSVYDTFYDLIVFIVFRVFQSVLYNFVVSVSLMLI